MALRTNVRVTERRDAATAAREAPEAFAMDMASVGFERSQEIIADEATDTGQLLRSGVPPERQKDGSIVWGYVSDYARYVDEGQEPHWPPIEPLLGWARRVLGDESAAYAVQRKIAAEGTEPVDFIERSISTMRAWSSGRDMSDYLIDRL